MRGNKWQFTVVETKLIDYVKLRAQTYRVDKYGLSRMMMKDSCVKWARDGNITNFKISYGWINKTLQRYGMARINLHGEANNMTDEEVEAVIDPWRK